MITESCFLFILEVIKFKEKMKIIFIIALANVISCQSFLKQDDLNSLWRIYKNQFGKRYSLNDERQRKTIWEKHLKEIADHNLRANLGFYSYYEGLNEYSDLTSKEQIHLTMGAKANALPNNVLHFVKSEDTKIPDQLDWRVEGFVTPIKNQKTCGSCWAFSTTGALEGQHKKKTGTLVSLSEQNLIDCSKSNDGCDGGSIDEALNYIQSNGGIDTEASYPYEATNGSCRFTTSGIGATCQGHVDLPVGDEEALKQAVALVGPISVIIDACHNSFLSYKSGIFDEPLCRTDIPSHAVLVVGYGTEDGHDYWLVKNSWGKSWGMQGYIKMSRNKNNQCGIASRATYPVV